MTTETVPNSELERESTCADCRAKIIVYSEMTGLLPAELIDGRYTMHSWLVCELRRQINGLTR